jgi:HEAT repeat protein
LDDPAQLAAVDAYVKSELPRLRTGERLPNRKGVADVDLDHQLSQLCQFLGQRKYEKAEGALREFMPKHGDRLLPESRAAAVWALGMIHDGKAVADLVTLLEDRLNDAQSIPPEADEVRLMSAISLGRMHAESALESLQSKVPFAYPSGSAIHNACGWAVAQIKKETWPAPKDIEVVEGDWFLKPVKH